MKQHKAHNESTETASTHMSGANANSFSSSSKSSILLSSKQKLLLRTTMRPFMKDPTEDIIEEKQ